MTRTLVGMLLGALVLVGCSTSPPPDAATIAARLAPAVGAHPGITLTPETDPNRLLGRPGQYTSAATIDDARIPADLQGEPGGVDDGAKLEVFESEGDAQSRADYIAAIRDAGTPFGVEYSWVEGPVLLRVSGRLPPDVAESYRAALTDAVETATAP